MTGPSAHAGGTIGRRSAIAQKSAAHRLGAHFGFSVSISLLILKQRFPILGFGGALWVEATL
jgi:hypothetical protein